jgi:thiol-disulfide isomerase/thioredoxin
MTTMTIRIAASVLLLALNALPAIAGETKVDDGGLREGWHLKPSDKLYFRAADGTSLSEKEFLDRVNRGEPFWMNAPYNGKMSLTLGAPVNLVAPPKNQISKLLPGDLIPTFNAVALDGKHVSNAMFASKITLIDFFAVYCGHCIDEMPVLNAFKAAHPDIQTVAITYDPAPYVSDLVQTHHFTWRVVPDAIPVFNSWGLFFTPTYALVDQDGRVIDLTLGSMMAPKGQQLTESDIASWIGRHVAISLKQ